MTEKKINAFQQFDDVEMKHLQVVYLAHYNINFTEIAKWTGYKIATLKGYVRKFANLLEKAKKIFLHIPNTVKQVVYGRKELVYLFKFYTDTEELVYSKVGTTTRLPEVRLDEEIKDYQKKIPNLTKGVICSVIDCGDVPAECAESIARAYFIRKYPKAYLKNDRFCGVDISPRTFNKIVNKFLTEKVEDDEETA